MISSRRFFVVSLLVIAMALSSVSNPNASRAADPWDQETVTAIATLLFDNIKEIRLMARKAPVQQRSQQKVQEQALENYEQAVELIPRDGEQPNLMKKLEGLRREFE